MEKVELDKITKLVDDFVVQLKKDLLAVEYKPTKTGVLPGVWDRMKNWWYNSVLKKGGNDTNNPYVYKNKFGALGHEDDVKEESRRLSLSQYNFIKEQYNKLEFDLSVLNEDVETESENLKKLKLWRIIDNWAGKFKQEIVKQFSGSIESKESEATPPAEDAETSTAPMEAPPSGSAGASEDSGSGVGPSRGRGRPPRIRISWNKDSGWGPKSKDGRLPENSINWIKKKVFEKLNEKKEDHPNFESTFDKDFEKTFEDILKDNEDELKSHPSEVSDVEKTKSKWEGFLAKHIAERLHVTLVSRDLGLM